MSDPSFFRFTAGKTPTSPVWKAYFQLDRTQWLRAEALERWQMHQLQVLLTHCGQHVPYYRGVFCTNAIAPGDLRNLADFRRFPLLSRQTWQARFPEFVAEKLPPNMTPLGTASTSGTSGVAIELRQTNITALWWLAFYLRDLEWCQIDPCGSLACIRTVKLKNPEQQRRFREGISQPFWHPSLRDVIHSGTSFGMDLHQDQRQQLAWLRQIDPNYLLSHPPNLDYLGHLLVEEGIKLPGLRAIQSFSDTLDDDVRQRIEAAFGVPVKNTYSCMEAGYLASPCPQGHGLHVHGENVILEVLDDEGRPCEPGQTGRVVITTLHNYLTPFLRYEIMDSATCGPATCPCGRGLPLLTKVDGKHRPLFRLPDGRRKATVSLLHKIREAGPHRQQQLLQKGVDHVLVRIVPSPGWTDEHTGRISAIVNEFFETPIRTEVEVIDRLVLPPGGKLQEVISELDKRQSDPAL